MPKELNKANESDWFRTHEKEMLEKAAQERERRIQQTVAKQKGEELDRLRAAHWMKCPKCGHDMKAKTMDGLELDNCTFCEGIYFDRGELESLLLRRMPQRFKFYRRFFGLD